MFNFLNNSIQAAGNKFIIISRQGKEKSIAGKDDVFINYLVLIKGFSLYVLYGSILLHISLEMNICERIFMF